MKTACICKYCQRYEYLRTRNRSQHCCGDYFFKTFHSTSQKYRLSVRNFSHGPYKKLFLNRKTYQTSRETQFFSYHTPKTPRPFRYSQTCSSHSSRNGNYIGSREIYSKREKSHKKQKRLFVDIFQIQSTLKLTFQTAVEYFLVNTHIYIHQSFFNNRLILRIKCIEFTQLYS